jgi:hypothetical protein
MEVVWEHRAQMPSFPDISHISVGFRKFTTVASLGPTVDSLPCSHSHAWSTALSRLRPTYDGEDLWMPAPVPAMQPSISPASQLRGEGPDTLPPSARLPAPTTAQGDGKRWTFRGHVLRERMSSADTGSGDSSPGRVLAMSKALRDGFHILHS